MFYDESNLTTPDLFDHSETGKDGIAVRFDGNQTIKLEQDVSTYNIQGPFSVCFWIKSEDLNADILESSRFAIKLADGFFWGQAQVGGVIENGVNCLAG